MKIDFYDEYFSAQSFSDKRQEMKDKYIRNRLNNNTIYKFIPITESQELNNNKINLLECQQLWVSNYQYFQDKNEFKHTYNISKISEQTGLSIERIITFINTTNQLNDVSCFTYQASEYMWKNYANNENGFCLEFQLLNSDKFFPVIYCNKSTIDFTEEYTKAFIEGGFQSIDRLCLLPWVLKDECFKNENELRFLCGSVYDDEEGPLGGKIFNNKKELLNYKGITFSYNYSGIKLKDIIIGKNCSKEYRKKLEFIKNNLAH